jgi:hypothetical protein
VARPADDEVVLAEALVRRSRWPWIVLVAVTPFLAALVSFRFTIAPRSSRFGDLLVTASAVGVQHVGTVSLHEIEVEVSPRTWDSFLQTVPTYLLAFVIGVMGSLVAATLFNRWEPRRRRKAKVAPPSAPLDAS